MVTARLRGGCSDDFHFLPVVRKLLATVQTHHIGSGEGGRRVSTEAGTNCNRKTVAVVPAAAKESIEEFGIMFSPSTRAVSDKATRTDGAS